MTQVEPHLRVRLDGKNFTLGFHGPELEVLPKQGL